MHGRRGMDCRVALLLAMTIFNFKKRHDMSFKMTAKPTFSAAVKVNVPNDQGGFDKNTFTAKFRRPTQEEAVNLRDANMMPEELVRKMMVDWDMTDGDTNERVPFSHENLEAALQILPTPLACAVAFWESVSGSRAKN